MNLPTLPSRRTVAALALAALTAPGFAVAETWPSHAITLIVPYAAGGPTDVLARLVAKKVGTDLGQTVIIDNRGGAGGTIGVNATVKAAPDGYTFSLTGPGPLAGMPNLMKMPYAPGDYQYLTLIARVPAVIVVNTSAGVANLGDLVKQAKATPTRFNYGSAGAGTTPHIGIELFKQEAGIEMTHVPYKGAAPAVTALLGGEIQLAMLDLPPVLQHVNAGKLKVLAVAGTSRAPQIPDVPTTKELGYPGVLMDTNYGVIAPKGLPADIQKKFRDAVVAALASPELKAEFLKQGAVATASTPQEYAALMASEQEKWHKVITRGNIKLD